MSNEAVPNNGTPILEMDPAAAEMVQTLAGLANAIAKGSPMGAVLIYFDHSTGSMSMKHYIVGDPYRCSGFMRRMADVIVIQEEQKQRGKPQILVAR